MSVASTKISIVTPSFNQGQFIEDTILSVIGQNYPNVEYIIMDGGSTDNTVEIIKKYESKISYWVSEPDEGQAAAINNGFSIATGDILMWLNSDDMLMPNILNYIVSSVEKKGNGLFFGNCINFKEGNDLTSYGSDVIKANERFKINEVDFIIQPSSFWTRKTWIQVGRLNTTLHFGFDWEWFIRAKEAGIKFFPISKTLSIYRWHDSHKTGTGGKQRQIELASIYEQYNPRLVPLYQLLTNERNVSFSKMSKLVLLAHAACCWFFHIENSQGRKLKFLRPYKFRKYKIYEIDMCLSMC